MQEQEKYLQHVEAESSQEVAAVTAVKKLIAAKVGEPVEVTVRLMGPMALSYRNGVKPSYDEKGRIQTTFSDNPESGVIGRNYTVTGLKEYDTPAEFLYAWSGEHFFGKFEAAVLECIRKNKKDEFDNSVKNSKTKRYATALRYLKQGFAYGDKGSIILAFQEAKKVALTGETPETDNDFTLHEFREDADNVIRGCFDIDSSNISVSEGTDKGNKALMATFTVTKRAPFPFTEAEVLSFANRLKY